MQKINTPDGLFHEGNPATGELGTIVTSAWMNAVQSELAGLVAGLGGTLDPNVGNQISQLLAEKLSGKAPSATTLAGYGITDAAPKHDAALTGTPTAPTPPQFGADSSLATAAFVQRALGNWRGFAANTAGGTFTLAAADAGKTIVLSGSSVTGTLALPKIGTVPDGAGWLIKCEATTSNWSIATHADDGANMVVGLAVASVPIRRGDYAIITRGGGSWRVHGSVCLPYSDSFANQLTAIGYQRLPSGLIMQWGQAAAAATAGQPTTITLPIANPVATRSITITRTGGTAGVDFNTFTISDITTTNFVVRAQVSGSPTFFWMAIGH
ncbi:hypothetical protein [Microvirgula aerodenitrificans]|uniref:gp53-like domain-containing protein n=1 Tax=Microvirgula aerodenitrificans TaxID=57480 RepID=UPI0028E6E250|nr:hypothetical protein [Microvirgula aerodenitrificans]